MRAAPQASPRSVPDPHEVAAAAAEAEEEVAVRVSLSRAPELPAAEEVALVV